MAMPTQLEIERIVNLIRGFGWEKKGEQIQDDKIVLTIEKKLELKTTPSST